MFLYLLGAFSHLYGQVMVSDGFTITQFLTAGIRNPTRLAFDGQGRLFVAQLDGTISIVEDTGRLEVYARGLRNVYDLAFHPVTGELFATDNGRDDLGPNQPPEELDLIVQGGHYGWPDIPPAPVAGSGTIGPIAEFPAHSSADGMAFYDDLGNRVQGPDITNPRVLSLSPGIQRALLGNEIFGNGLRSVSGWVDVASSNSELKGFFLSGDRAVSFLGGADARSEPAAQLVFTGIMEGVSLEGVRALTEVNAARSLNAQPLTGDSGATRLFSAQLASGGGFFTDINLVNINETPATISMAAYGDSSIGLGRPHSQSLAPHETYFADAASLFRLHFGTANPNVTTGYIKIESDASGLYGDVWFGSPTLLTDPGVRSFMAGLPLSRQGAIDMIFSHLAQGTGAGFWTGIAILNPADEVASVRMEVYNDRSQKTGEALLYIPAGQKLARFIDEFVPTVANQSGGYVRITSDRPVIAFELFGNFAMDFMAAVPPQ